MTDFKESSIRLDNLIKSNLSRSGTTKNCNKQFFKVINDNNPWKNFTCLKCPECQFETKNEKIFGDHAVKHHALSTLLFKDTIKQTLEVIKVR